MSDDFILETEDLTKEFAGFVAVSGVTLRVARGTIAASGLVRPANCALDSSRARGLLRTRLRGVREWAAAASPR